MMTAAEFVRDDIDFRLNSVAPSARLAPTSLPLTGDHPAIRDILADDDLFV